MANNLWIDVFGEEYYAFKLWLAVFVFDMDSF